MDFRKNQGEYPPFHLLKSVVLLITDMESEKKRRDEAQTGMIKK